MSKFGLTATQRKTKPWGLSEELLEPAKTITDPIHGDIFVCVLELHVLDSPPMQRLRRIRQLGTTHLVYPGATHTRFSHSLGALRTAQNLLDAVIDHGTLPNSTPDLLAEWQDSNDGARMLSEAIVLTRLGALLHDMCHVPYGHSIEDDLRILAPHDENEQRFSALWSELQQSLRESLSNNDDKSPIGDELAQALRPLILSKSISTNGTDQRYPFVADIVGNTICADLIDYLQRDHYYTGLPARLGRRFMDGFYVTPSDHPYQQKRMVVQISRDGRRRSDVISEMLKYLRYRYELSERVIVHHAKVAADVMIGRLLETWLKYLRVSANNKNPEEMLERQLSKFGDDGFLEHILETLESGDERDDNCHALVDVCKALLNRRLYKLIGHSRQVTLSDEVYKKYGNQEERRALENEVAKFAGLDYDWHVLLWVPSPEMRLKGADVLVDDNGTISKLSSMVDVGGGAGRQIQEDHRALWTFGVYVHPEVRREKHVCDLIVAWIGHKVPGIEWNEYNEQPDLSKLMLRAAAERLNTRVSDEGKLLELVQAVSKDLDETDFASMVQGVVDAYEKCEQGEMSEGCG